MTSYKHGGLDYLQQVSFDAIGKEFNGGFLLFPKNTKNKKKKFIFF